MNDIINKWNNYIELRNDQESNIEQYMINNNIKIIDLKCLREINIKDVFIYILDTIEEYKEILKMAYYNLHPEYLVNKFSGRFGSHCKNYLNLGNECENYNTCFLCSLDYLVNVNRIKIIEIQEGLINE